MSYSSNSSTHHIDSPNSKSRFYQAAKAKVTNNKYSSPTLKSISPASISFPTSLLVSPRNNDLSIPSTLRFQQNTTKPANSEPNSAKRTTPTAGSSSVKTPRSPMALNFHNIKHMPENKSLNFSARTTSHEKNSSEAKRSTPNSGLRTRTEADDMEIINQLYFSVTDKLDGKKTRDLSNNSLDRSKNSNQEKGNKSPMSSSRGLAKKPSKIPDRTSKSPISRESSKRDTSADIKGKRLSLKKEPSITNTTGQKTPLRDSSYNFESRAHSKSYSEPWEHFMEANKEQLSIHTQGNKLKSDSITLENIENPALDSLIKQDQRLSQFESRNPAFKTRVEELQYEKEQDMNQLKQLHGELSVLQNRVKTPQRRSFLSEVQTTEPSPKSPEDGKALNINMSPEDLKQKEIDMLRIQNENFKMTIEFLKNENHILKEAQKQSLQYKDMAIKYKELAETKIKECYILAEEVITLRKDAQNATSCVLKPIYSDLSLCDPKIEPVPSKLESLQIPSFPQISLDKVPERATESFASGKSSEISTGEKQPTQQNEEEVPNHILSQIQPQPVSKSNLKFNIYGGRRGEV